MKTAMQELIEFIELNIDDNDFIKHQVLEEADKALEIEKNQIINACNSAFEDKTTWGERYYKQKYNNGIQ